VSFITSTTKSSMRIFFFEILTSVTNTCAYCEKTCIDKTLQCRICNRTYHSKCLYERNHLDDPNLNPRRMTRLDWSCPACVRYHRYYLTLIRLSVISCSQQDMTKLINNSDMQYLIQLFEHIDKDKGHSLLFSNRWSCHSLHRWFYYFERVPSF
jgi:hypothetical protein